MGPGSSQEIANLGGGAGRNVRPHTHPQTEWHPLGFQPFIGLALNLLGAHITVAYRPRVETLVVLIEGSRAASSSEARERLAASVRREDGEWPVHVCKYTGQSASSRDREERHSPI